MEYKVKKLSVNETISGEKTLDICIGIDTTADFIFKSLDIAHTKECSGCGKPKYTPPIGTWLEKAQKEASENLKEKFKEVFKNEMKPEKEKHGMEYAERIEITFKNGDTISYGKDEWDDYGYDGKAIMVKQKGAWIGIYNFDQIFCVELKEH